LVVCTTLFLVVLLYFAFKTGGIKISRDGDKGLSISFGVKKKNKKINTHAGCKYLPSVIFALNKVRDIEGKLYEIKYNEKISSQMDCVEGSVKISMNFLLKNYIFLLKEKGFIDPLRTAQCQSYVLLLRLIEYRIISKMREYVRKNHLAERNETEFDSYVDTRITAIHLLLNESLNDLYHYDDIVSRAEIHDVNAKTDHDFKDEFKKCFHKCRVISIDIKKKIELLEKESNSIFSMFLANPNE